MEYSGSAEVRKYLEENRDDVMRLIRNEDTFLRALGFAVLLEAGDKADTKLVKKELELLEDVSEEHDPFNR